MADSPKKISILLASDFPILSDSLVTIFKGTKDLKLVGSATSLDDLVQQMEKLHPEVVLVDISITCEKFSDLLAQISKRNARVLVINQDLSPGQTLEALRNGVHGVVGRRTTPDLLCKCVRAVVSGDIWVGRGVTAELVEFLRSQALHQDNGKAPATPENPVPAEFTWRFRDNRFGLTKRELQIVNALVEAQTNKDIAETFGISEYTVKHHLTNIFDKLGVYNRVELALFAINHRLCGTVPLAPQAELRRREKPKAR